MLSEVFKHCVGVTACHLSFFFICMSLLFGVTGNTETEKTNNQEPGAHF